jgi:hypothetical protein
MSVHNMNAPNTPNIFRNIARYAISLIHLGDLSGTSIQAGIFFIVTMGKSLFSLG